MAFGGAPEQVYIKKKDEDLGWGGIGGKKKGRRLGGGAVPSESSAVGDPTHDKGRSHLVTPGVSSLSASPSGSRSHSPELQQARRPQRSPEPEKPKTREMKKIERMIEGVKKMSDGQTAEASAMDEQEGCFCLGKWPLRVDATTTVVPNESAVPARVHRLSAYTPSCAQCGLILCNLHLPYHPCPGCKSALLGSSGIMRVLTRLNDEFGMLYRKEEQQRRLAEEKEREAFLAASGGGAFPSLSATAGTSVATKEGSKPNTGERKVMRIGGNSKTTAAQKVKGGQKMGNKTKTTVVVTRSAAPNQVASQSLDPISAKNLQDQISGKNMDKVHKTPRPIILESETGARRWKELQEQKKFNDMWRNQEDRKFGDRIAVVQGWGAEYEPITKEEKRRAREKYLRAIGKWKDKTAEPEQRVVPGSAPPPEMEVEGRLIKSYYKKPKNKKKKADEELSA